MLGDPQELALIAAIADEAPVGLWVAKAPGGELIYANATFAEIMGMSARADVAVGAYAQPYGIHDRTGALYPEARMPFVRAIQEKQTVVLDDIVIHRHDGQRVFIRAVAKPTVDERGEVTRVAIAFIEITREVLAEEQRERLRLTAERIDAQLKDVINAAPIVLFAQDPAGKIVLAEGRGLRDLEMEPGGLLGKSAGELYGPQVAQNIARAGTGESFTDVVEAVGRTYQVSYRPDRDSSNAVVGVVGVAVDITEQRRLSAQLLQADRMATVGTMAASVAHEINTPLSVLVTGLQGIQRELGSLAAACHTPEQTATLKALGRLLDDAELAANRIRSTSRDLTTFARADDAMAGVEPQAVLESALRLVPKHLRAELSIERSYAPTPRVAVQEARLAQVFLNLLVNAVQALPPEGRQALALSARTGPEGTAVIEIADNGPGIPEPLRDRIFDPFFTTKPPGVGTGLGLTICRNIVTQLGGTIELSPRQPSGTVARVTLPAAPPELAVEPPTPRPTAAASRTRVLVVDDDQALGRVLRVSLEPWHELTFATGGREALALLRAGRRFDVMLCDLMMGDGSGMELYDTLATELPGLESQLTFMTGGAYTQQAQQFLKRIPNVTLQKPFDFGDAVVRLALRRAGTV